MTIEQLNNHILSFMQSVKANSVNIIVDFYEGVEDEKLVKQIAEEEGIPTGVNEPNWEPDGSLMLGR